MVTVRFAMAYGNATCIVNIIIAVVFVFSPYIKKVSVYFSLKSIFY